MILITISRMMGAGAEIVSEHVAKELKLELYNDERLPSAAREMGLKTEELAGLEEKQPGFFERLWSMKPVLMLDLLQAVVYEIARRGNAVIVGHGGQVLLKEFDCALHVHIQASLTTRVERVMKLRNLDRATAEKLVLNSDNQRKGFLSYAFNMNWDDPALYDMVINTEKVGIDTATQMILGAARSGEIKECGPLAVEAMARMVLTRRAEAKLLEAAFSPSALTVRCPKEGVVEVSGWVITNDDKDNIRMLLKEIPAVKEVVLNVAVRPVEAE